MNLTKQSDRFPRWPLVKADYAEGVVWVEARHITYASYLLAHWILKAIVAAPWILILWALFDKSGGVGAAFGLFFIWSIGVAIYMILPTPYLVARFFSPTETVVSFSTEHVWIANKTYEWRDAQFITGESPIPKRKFHKLSSQRLHKHEEAKLDFRNVEMVYGGNRIIITTVPTIEKAQQFTVALQMACAEAAKLKKPEPEPALSGSKTVPLEAAAMRSGKRLE